MCGVGGSGVEGRARPCVGLRQEGLGGGVGRNERGGYTILVKVIRHLS